MTSKSPRMYPIDALRSQVKNSLCIACELPWARNQVFPCLTDLPRKRWKALKVFGGQHAVLYSSPKSHHEVKIIVNVDMVVVVVVFMVVVAVVVRLVVVNGWRRRGDKSTATAARPPHHCNRPRWTCKQPIQSPQPSHKLPASAAHHPQITGM